MEGVKEANGHATAPVQDKTILLKDGSIRGWIPISLAGEVRNGNGLDKKDGEVPVEVVMDADGKL